MKMSSSLTKKIAMTMASYLAITSAVFAYPEKDYTPEVIPLTTLKVSNQNSYGSFELEEKNIGTASNSVIIDIPAIEDEATATLNQLKNQSQEEATKLDKMIKMGLIAAGMTAGAGVAWFYGPALAFTAAYHGSLLLAQIATPNPSWLTLNAIIKPAAIDAGVYFANSGIVKMAIGTASTSMGYAFGKVGCASYDLLKSAGSAGLGVAKSGLGWFGSKVWG